MGVHLESDLSFDHHVSTLYKKAGQKLSALIRLGRYHTFEQRRVLMKAFIDSQFGHSPLSWMFYSRGMNAKINRLHERVLRHVYQNSTNSFAELLKLDGSVTIHNKNIQILALELFKVKHGLVTKK